MSEDETRPGRARLTFGVEDPRPEPIEHPSDLAAYVQQDALIRTVLRTLDGAPVTGGLPERVATLVEHVQRQRSCLGLLASLAPPHIMERYRQLGREQGILGPDWSPEPVSRKTVENVIRAARELDAQFGYDADRDRAWLGGQPISDECVDISGMLLSLHDYLNDVERETGGTL